MNNDNGFKNKNLWKPLKKVYRKTPLPRIRYAFAQPRIVYRYSKYGLPWGSIRIEVSSLCQLRCVLCARTHSRLKGQFDKVVPYVFKYAFEQITDIKNDIISCNTMKNMGINVFML